MCPPRLGDGAEQSLEAAVRETLGGPVGHHAVGVREVPEQFVVAGVDGREEVAGAAVRPEMNWAPDSCQSPIRAAKS